MHEREQCERDLKEILRKSLEREYEIAMGANSTRPDEWRRKDLLRLALAELKSQLYGGEFGDLIGDVAQQVVVRKPQSGVKP